MAQTVTVTLRSERICKDFVLPADVPLRELCPRVLAVLQKYDSSLPDDYDLVLEREKGGMLNLDATLAQYGVVDGMYLDIARKEKYNGIG